MVRLYFIHEFTAAKEYNGEEVLYVQQKYDGHRLICLRQPDDCPNKTIFYTRSQTDLFPEMYEKAKKHNIWPWIEDLIRLKSRTSIDGELHVSGQPASYVKTAIKECDPSLKFSVFALPWVNGVRMYTEPLEQVIERAESLHLEFIPFIKLDRVEPIDTNTWLKKVDSSIEGFVLKRHHYVGWYKLKPKRTIDLIVTGLTEGQGKYSGQVGSLYCSAIDAKGQYREICVCSGMTDEERLALSKEDVGRVVEVQYQEVSSLGRLRHPIFLRFREDKQPFECDLSQDINLLRYWSTR